MQHQSDMNVAPQQQPRIQCNLPEDMEDIAMMSCSDPADDLSMIDFFDADDLLNDESIKCEAQQHHPQSRRASIEFAREMWSSSECEESFFDGFASALPLHHEDGGSDEDNGANKNFGGAASSNVPPGRQLLDAGHSSSVNDAGAGRSGSGGGGFDQNQYNELLSKLAESMKRSERSRAEIMRQRKNGAAGPPPPPSAAAAAARASSGGSAFQRCSSMCMSSSAGACSSPSPAPPTGGQEPLKLNPADDNAATNAANVPTPQSCYPKALTSFLSGSQSTLTAGLEQSRRQLAAYMTQMSRHSAAM